MQKIILNPLLAPVAVILFIATFFAIYIPQGPDAVFNFTQGALEYITAATYVVPFIVLIAGFNRITAKEHKKTVFLSFVLLICAALREAGIQHWLTTTDTTAFKLRFFTNPNNPICEKILAASLLLLVGSLVIYMLVRYASGIIRGFFKFNPMYWTICTLGGTGIVGKIVDRFPGNWRKAHGEALPDDINALFSLFEETSEATLPLLFALALWQFCQMQKNKKVR